MPFNVKALKANVDSTWCQVEPFAVKAFDGDEDIYIGDMFITGSFTKAERQTGKTLKVGCVAAANIASCELVKIDTEGCEVEVLQNLDLSKTKAIMLEHHSLSDALIIKEILAEKFELVHDESDRIVGIEIFLRK
jgi:FkbM family methyltransferase